MMSDGDDLSVVNDDRANARVRAWTSTLGFRDRPLHRLPCSKSDHMSVFELGELLEELPDVLESPDRRWRNEHMRPDPSRGARVGRALRAARKGTSCSPVSTSQRST